MMHGRVVRVIGKNLFFVFVMEWHFCLTGKLVLCEEHVLCLGVAPTEEA